MTMIGNPILPGFNPDPSICRVGDDYFVATSTFEWFPGVQIHHSRDLVNWRLVRRPLDRAAQLDLRGDPDSGGVWAPCLSYADGRFWLVYTDVKRFDGAFKDAHNYIVTAPAIEGPWSDPIYVNSSGFDPSLFHDDDGRKWFLNMLWDHRDGPGGNAKASRLRRHLAAGMGCRLRQAFREGEDDLHRQPAWPRRRPASAQARRLVLSHDRRGRHRLRPRGDDGPSRRIDGPFELHPNVHLITSKDAPGAALQRAGHGQIVETPDGQVYHTHLCSRPLVGSAPFAARARDRDPEMRLARRRLALSRTGRSGSRASRFQRRSRPPSARGADRRRRFRHAGLPTDFQWLRTPYPERIFSLAARPGWLRLIARESIGSWFEQALVARRQEHFAYRAETELEFAPELSAGGRPHRLLQPLQVPLPRRVWDEKLGRALTIMSCEGDYPEGRLSFPLGAPIASTRRARAPRRARRARQACSSPTRSAARGGTSVRRSTPRSSRTKRAAANIARSPAPSSAWPRSTRPAPR